ncbi:MAG: hypothetical protein IKM61_09620 [Eubacteriaceae bacterium]|nr:hypothetical protein [Eubacteriaceae bacterium]
MVHTTETEKLINDIVGKRLDDLSLACEMMMFSFGEYSLHSQCLTRIVMNDEIITTTSDYQSWDGVNAENNDEWYFVGKYKDMIIGGTVLSVRVNPLHDVVICMDNGVRIELFISDGLYHFGEDNEQWVFFRRHDHSFPFVTVYAKSVDIAYEW